VKQKNPNPQGKGLVPVLAALASSLGKSMQLTGIAELRYEQAQLTQLT
jgi:hypothetical protein